MIRYSRWLAPLALAACLLAVSNPAESRRAQRDVPPDANPDSAFWRGTPVVFLENDARGNPVPGFRTEERSRWTAANLYFLFICPYEQLYLKPNPRADIETNELWNWDVAEVFIGSDFKNIRRYTEFEVSPQAEWLDLDINLDARRHEDGWPWNSGFQAAARIDRAARRWYAFMRIPYASVDARPAAAGNLLRQFLPLRGSGAESQRALMAGHRPLFLPCAGGVRIAQASPLTPASPPPRPDWLPCSAARTEDRFA